MSQTKQKPYLTYALNANGKLVHIDSVSTGLSCRCFCPNCKSELVAKNGGNRMSHHFAHANGSDCVGAIESALHRMAKDILKEYRLIMLPPIQRNRIAKQTLFSNVEVEVFDKEFSMRPDCIGYTENGRPIWVEFKRTHEVDVKKACKIISAKIDCVEIDLNSCELDPEKVRGFIERSGERRNWIYNHENPKIYQCYEKNRILIKNDYDWNLNFRPTLPRHLAVDEQNNIVNLCDFNQINVRRHTYFCLACGREVYIHMDRRGNYSFLHLEGGVLCDYDFYLHEAAKKVLCAKFKNSKKFEVYIPQCHVCEKGYKFSLFDEACSLFEENCCSTTLPVPFDLKMHGYDSCKIEYKFPRKHFSYDVVLMRGNDLKTAVVIAIDANACYIEHGNIKNRIIVVSVRCERDVLRLYENPLRGRGLCFFNFENKNVRTTSWENIKREVLKFTLFSDGKYHLKTESCMRPKEINAIYEMVISKGIGTHKAIRQYAILHCYNNQKVLCLCEICYFLKRRTNFFNQEEICIRYKTKGTPRNPLETMPVKCPYFSLDRNLRATLEKVCHNLCFIEEELK